MTIRVRLLYDKQKKTKYINYIYGEYFEEGVREASTNLKRGTEAATAKHFKRCTGELKVAIGWVRPTAARFARSKQGMAATLISLVSPPTVQLPTTHKNIYLFNYKAFSLKLVENKDPLSDW